MGIQQKRPNVYVDMQPPHVLTLFESSTLIKVPQDKMLTRDNNKRRLIDFLCSGFHLEGIETHRATEDADSIIVGTALEKSKGVYNRRRCGSARSPLCLRFLCE
uniref:Uncharacterized protein n=1 Tax=Cacopsylla melanoneura TaxID=428564 RepID=A0A8D9DNY9_9HEMI